MNHLQKAKKNKELRNHDTLDTYIKMNYGDIKGLGRGTTSDKKSGDRIFEFVKNPQFLGY